MLSFLAYFRENFNGLYTQKTDWKFVLFLVSFVELMVGGGGRIFDLGGFTLRMVLFVATQSVVWFSILRGSYKPSRDLLWLFGSFVVVTAFSAGIGYLNQSPLSAILTDLKPLLFWANLLFYAQVVRSWEQVEGIKRYIRWTTVLLAASYLLFLLIWRLRLIDGWAFYQWVRPSQEFFYRGSLGFFFKGFIFLPIGIFFWQQRSGYTKFFWIFIIYLALLLTFTRGLWLLIFGIHLLYTLLYNSRSLVSWLLVLLMVSSVFSVTSYVKQVKTYDFEGLEVYQQKAEVKKPKVALSPLQKKIGGLFSQGFENRQVSMIGRFVQFEEVAAAVSWRSLFIGHGLGQGVPSRPIHMEVSYLEIFHKQGLLGLGLWVGLVVVLWRRFYQQVGARLRNIHYQHPAFAFFISATFMVVISFTNPFINSPMGLGMLALALVVLKLPKAPAAP